MRKHASPVGTELESQHLRKPQRMHVHLPARGTVRQRRLFEDFGKPLAREMHLLSGPFGAGAVEPVLPLDVVPAMDADVEALIAYAAHDVARPSADVGSRQHRA